MQVEIYCASISSLKENMWMFCCVQPRFVVMKQVISIFCISKDPVHPACNHVQAVKAAAMCQKKISTAELHICRHEEVSQTEPERQFIIATAFVFLIFVRYKNLHLYHTITSHHKF